MQRIQKSYPVLIAWLAYVIFAWLLKMLFGLGLVWLQKSYPFDWFSDVFPFIGIGILIAAEYIAFTSSVRWLALPLSLVSKNHSRRPKSGSLISEWLSFCYYFILFCLPLILINAFPGLTLGGLSIYVPFSNEVANFIGFIWKSIVSLFVYRSTIISYLKDKATEPSNTRDDKTIVS